MHGAKHLAGINLFVVLYNYGIEALHIEAADGGSPATETANP